MTCIIDLVRILSVYYAIHIRIIHIVCRPLNIIILFARSSRVNSFSLSEGSPGGMFIGEIGRLLAYEYEEYILAIDEVVTCTLGWVLFNARFSV